MALADMGAVISPPAPPAQLVSACQSALPDRAATGMPTRGTPLATLLAPLLLLLLGPASGQESGRRPAGGRPAWKPRCE